MNDIEHEVRRVATWVEHWPVVKEAVVIAALIVIAIIGILSSASWGQALINTIVGGFIGILTGNGIHPQSMIPQAPAPMVTSPSPLTASPMPYSPPTSVGTHSPDAA